MLEILNETWLQAIVATVVISIPLYQITRIVKINLNKKKIVLTHEVKIMYSEPTKDEGYYENDIKGLKLGLKIRGRNFKHEMIEGLDVIRIRGSKKEMESFITSRKNKINSKLEKWNKFTEKTGSTKTEELFEIEKK